MGLSSLAIEVTLGGERDFRLLISEPYVIPNSKGSVKPRMT